MHLLGRTTGVQGFDMRRHNGSTKIWTSWNSRRKSRRLGTTGEPMRWQGDSEDSMVLSVWA